MGFTTAEALKLTFKVQAGGVIDAASGNQWYESKFPFNPYVKVFIFLTPCSKSPHKTNLESKPAERGIQTSLSVKDSAVFLNVLLVLFII